MLKIVIINEQMRRSKVNIIATLKKFRSSNKQPTQDTKNSKPKHNKKFLIKGTTPSYQPKKKLIPNFGKVLNSNYKLKKITEKFPSQNNDERKEASHLLYIHNKAFDSIRSHISWEERTKNNIVEQGGILLGETFIDQKQGITYGVVEKSIPATLAQGSAGYLDINHQAWKEMLEKADDYREPHKSEVQIIGWYHTHPNNLDVFMSGTDIGTQKQFFSHDWQFAIVLNPHKKIWKAFYGANANECQGHVISSSSKFLT